MTLESRSSFLFLVLILLGSSNVFSQTRKELEERRFSIIEQIDNTNELLQLTAKNKKVILSDLRILESQIDNRRLLLEQIEKEIDIIDRDIRLAEVREGQISLRLDSLKVQYDVILRAVYRERALHNPVLSLLSMESVTQSFLKANFYNRLKEFVSQKLEGISVQQDQLEAEIALLNSDRSLKRQVLQQEAQQTGLLNNEMEKQKVMISSMQEDEASLEISLDAQKRDREQMNVRIEKVIQSEFAAPVESGSSSAFGEIKGQMQWPVSGGVISSKYGKQRHPTMKNLTITNNGIDIRAPLRADVKVVFGGKVVSVSEMAGFGVTIIVDHDQYYTVYSKLGQSAVKKEDVLTKGQSVGTLDVQDDSSELHFEIWKDNKTQNPVSWLRK